MTGSPPQARISATAAWMKIEKDAHYWKREENAMQINVKDLDAVKSHHLLRNLVMPRPIALSRRARRSTKA